MLHSLWQNHLFLGMAIIIPREGPSVPTTFPPFFLEDTMREIRVGWQTQLFPSKFVAEKNSELNNVHTSLNIVAFFFSLK